MIELVAATTEAERRRASGQFETRADAATSQDPPNLTSLYAQFGGAIHRLALGSTHDAAEADDVCQEIWLRVHRDLDALHDASAARSWLFRVAQRICVDTARRRCAAAQSVDAASEVAAPDDGEPEKRALSLDQRSLGWEALAWLPERQQAVLILRERSGCSYEELARVMESTVPAIETLLFRARRNLLQARKAIESSAMERCKRAAVIRTTLESGAVTPARRIATLRHSATCMGCVMVGRRRMSVGAWLGALLRPLAELPVRFLPAAGLAAAPLSTLVGTVVTVSTLTVASSSAATGEEARFVYADSPSSGSPSAPLAPQEAGSIPVAALPPTVPTDVSDAQPSPPVLSAVPAPNPVGLPVPPADETHVSGIPGPFVHPGDGASGGGAGAGPAPAAARPEVPGEPVAAPAGPTAGPPLPEGSPVAPATNPPSPSLPIELPVLPPLPWLPFELPTLPPLPQLPIELPALPPLPELEVELPPLPPLPPLPALPGLPPVNDLVDGLPAVDVDPSESDDPGDPLLDDILPKGLPDVEDLPTTWPVDPLAGLGKLLPI